MVYGRNSLLSFVAAAGILLLIDGSRGFEMLRSFMPRDAVAEVVKIEPECIISYPGEDGQITTCKRARRKAMLHRQRMRMIRQKAPQQMQMMPGSLRHGRLRVRRTGRVLVVYRYRMPETDVWRHGRFAKPASDETVRLLRRGARFRIRLLQGMPIVPEEIEILPRPGTA